MLGLFLLMMIFVKIFFKKFKIDCKKSHKILIKVAHELD